MIRIRLIFIAIMGLLLILGLYLSSQDGATSAKLTDQLMKLIGLISESDIQDRTPAYSQYNFLFRKFGHFTMYAIATLPIFLFIYSFGKRLILTITLTLFIVMGYAVFDEMRQLLYGRNIRRLDAMIDTVGGCLTIGIATVSIWTQRIMNEVASRNE